MPPDITQRIQDHYNIDAMIERVQQAIESAGLGTGPLQWSETGKVALFSTRTIDDLKLLQVRVRPSTLAAIFNFF